VLIDKGVIKPVTKFSGSLAHWILVVKAEDQNSKTASSRDMVAALSLVLPPCSGEFHADFPGNCITNVDLHGVAVNP
jgi:hypothetical protein